MFFTRKDWSAPLASSERIGDPQNSRRVISRSDALVEACLRAAEEDRRFHCMHDVIAFLWCDTTSESSSQCSILKRAIAAFDARDGMASSCKPDKNDAPAPAYYNAQISPNTVPLCCTTSRTDLPCSYREFCTRSTQSYYKIRPPRWIVQRKMPPKHRDCVSVSLTQTNWKYNPRILIEKLS